MIKCGKCNDTGEVSYYHDAGDHFGAGTAPNSEWKTEICECQTQPSAASPMPVPIPYNNKADDSINADLDKFIKQYEKIIKADPSKLGWICPVCGRGNAPLTHSCPCRPIKYEITS